MLQSAVHEVDPPHRLGAAGIGAPPGRDKNHYVSETRGEAAQLPTKVLADRLGVAEGVHELAAQAAEPSHLALQGLHLDHYLFNARPALAITTSL